MNDLVSEQRDDERDDGDEDNADCKRAFAIRHFENNLATDDRVDHTPADASNDVCDGKDSGTVPTEGKSSECNGTETGLGTEGCHISGRNHADEIEEEDGQE